jgi:hypothetical protein
MSVNYLQQRSAWLERHPDATIEEAWEAGYWQATDNWCRKTR